MKVKELVEFVGNPKNKMLKQDQLQTTLQQKLEVKDYISIKDKKKLIDTIVDECILFEDGIYKFDDIDKYIYFTMKTIATYTNLEFSDDIESEYDELCKTKLLNTVIGTFVGEYENVKILLQMKCDDILSANNIEAQTGRFLTTLSDKINNFDINKLPINVENLSKFMKLIGVQKK